MNIANKFIIGGILLIIITIGSTVILSVSISDDIRNIAIERTEKINAVYLTSLASHDLTIEDFEPDNFDEKKSKFKNYFMDLKNDEAIRIKVWAHDGTIIYSDDDELIGQNFKENLRFQSSINGQLTSEIKRPIDPENVSEMGYGQLMEIYVPISLDTLEPIGVIELYFILDSVNESIDHTLSLVYLIAVILIGIISTSIIIFSVSILKLSRSAIEQEKFATMGSIASRLSHDLRNPLAIITVGLSLIIKQTKEEKTIQICKKIDASVKRMTHQINDVMNFVKPKPLHLQNITLHELLDSTLEDMIVSKDISVKKPSENPSISCDVEQMITVFHNIIFNAIQKLTGGGNITIFYNSDSENHIISIRDSGDPILDENLEKIFDPLFTTKQQGTGLGLYGCKQIIESHNGKIFASNDPTKFTILLPKKMI